MSGINIRKGENSVTECEGRKAFLRWRAQYQFQDMDNSLNELLNCKQLLCSAEPSEVAKRIEDKQRVIFSKLGLKKVRQALFISTESMGQKLDVAKSTYCEFEKNEVTGALKMSSLAKAAEAMDCELHYFIIPKSRKYFSQIVWSQLEAEALKHGWLNKCDQRRRGEALAGIAKWLMRDSKFKKKAGWSQLANKP